MLEPTASNYPEELRTLNRITDTLAAELDETVRLLSEGSAARTTSALRWTLASAGLIVALCGLLLAQAQRSEAAGLAPVRGE